MKSFLRIFLLFVSVMALCSCQTTESDDSVLKEVPLAPSGSTPLDVEQVEFRVAKVSTPAGKWTVDYGGDNIQVKTGAGTESLPSSGWYPEEGGADAAFVQGYLSGEDIWIHLVGTSDVITQETRMRFRDNKMVEAIRYSVPGAGMGPEMPPKPVAPEDRIKRQVFGDAIN